MCGSRISETLKSRRGIGIELAIIMLIIFTAFAMLIANVALLQNSAGRRAEEREAQTIALDMIGEEFVSGVKSGADKSLVLEALVGVDSTYTYEISEDMTTLVVKDGEVAVFTIALEKNDEQITITEWTR